RHVVQHLMVAVAALGVPQHTKTNNGPGYMARLHAFSRCGVPHVTAIPHSPTGQAIVEWAHGS
ncbi:POK18 protein, partial [Jacana jacana]|nr:POK18 protein [Jacana jacana]